MSVENEWIGRESRAEDTITARLAAEFRATIGALHCTLDAAPGLQWCLAPDIMSFDKLGRDGHPRTGLVLPDLGLPRRMWAGGRVTWSGGVAEGETVERVSTIRDIAFKDGRTGRLGFVTVDHFYACGGATRIREEQNIVYREDPLEGQTPPAPPRAAPWTGAKSRDVTPTPTLLFRYSAMTFNGHRIHYDLPYATGVEGYGGLVVHGPMQATWMHHLASDMLGSPPQEFSYRGVSPLICGRPATVEAREAEGGGLELRVRDVERDVVTMSANAR